MGAWERERESMTIIVHIKCTVTNLIPVAHSGISNAPARVTSVIDI